MTAVAEPFHPAPLAEESVTARREERLLRLLERASASSRFNLGERWLFALGGALVVAGFVAVIIGWSGASRTVLVAGQIPYLISGGLLGVGLVFLGGFLYFGHWVAVLVRESRERGAEDRDDLALLRAGLQDIHRSLAVVASALTSPAPAAGPVVDDTVPVLLATATGSMAHRPGCRALVGKPNLRQVRLADGFKACGMCRPLDRPDWQ